VHSELIFLEPYFIKIKDGLQRRKGGLHAHWFCVFVEGHSNEPCASEIKQAGFSLFYS
jgi:hypothetical protein